MRRKRPPHPAAFRAQMIEPVGAGRTPEELSREFEPSAQAIRNWVARSRSRCRPARSTEFFNTISLMRTCGHKNLKRKISQKCRIIFSY